MSDRGDPDRRSKAQGTQTHIPLTTPGEGDKQFTHQHTTARHDQTRPMGNKHPQQTPTQQLATTTRPNPPTRPRQMPSHTPRAPMQRARHRMRPHHARRQPPPQQPPMAQPPLPQTKNPTRKQTTPTKQSTTKTKTTRKTPSRNKLKPKQKQQRKTNTRAQNQNSENKNTSHQQHHPTGYTPLPAPPG